MYTLIGSKSSRALRVLWMLEELGLEYEHIAAEPRAAEVLAVNPSGKVPVLLVGGEAFTDSTAIMQFLADHHGGLTHPAGSLARLRQDSLTHFLLDEFDALLWMAARHSFTLPEDQRVPAIKPSLKWEFARSQQALANRMGPGPFLTGEQPTIPDLLLAHCLLWARSARFEITEPALGEHLQRMTARPAFQRATRR